MSKLQELFAKLEQQRADAGQRKYVVRCSYKDITGFVDVWLRPEAWENPGRVACRKAASVFKRRHDIHPCTRVQTTLQ